MCRLTRAGKQDWLELAKSAAMKSHGRLLQPLVDRVSLKAPLQPCIVARHNRDGSRDVVMRGWGFNSPGRGAPRPKTRAKALEKSLAPLSVEKAPDAELEQEPKARRRRRRKSKKSKLEAASKSGSEEKVEPKDDSEKPEDGAAKTAASGDGSATELAPESDDEVEAAAEVAPAEDKAVEAAEGGEAVNGETQEEPKAKKRKGEKKERKSKKRRKAEEEGEDAVETKESEEREAEKPKEKKKKKKKKERKEGKVKAVEAEEVDEPMQGAPRPKAAARRRTGDDRMEAKGTADEKTESAAEEEEEAAEESSEKVPDDDGTEGEADEAPKPEEPGENRNDELKRLIRGVYERKKPEKLVELEDLLVKYADNLEEAYKYVCQKYGEGESGMKFTPELFSVKTCDRRHGHHGCLV
eukprot:s140_g7.t1